jgi:hypothetical protein
MPLYKCEVTFDIVVDARDKKDAVKLADDNIHEEINNTGEQPIKITIKQITNIRDLPHNWLEATPWNKQEHSHTCSDILASKQFKLLICCKCKSKIDLVSVANQVVCKKCAIKEIRGKK